MKGDRPEAFLFFPKDFVSDNKVSALSPAEVGAYIRLLCRAWYEDPPGSLPDDDKLLANWTGMGRRNWLRAKPKVMSLWSFLAGTQRYYQKRLCSEYMYAKERSVKRSEKATKAANSRWDSYKTICSEQCLEHTPSIPQAMHEHTASNAPECQSQSQSQASSFPHSSEKEEANNSFCAETEKAPSAEPDDSPILLAFPCDGGKQSKDKTWNLTEAQLAEWKELFPSLDLLAECRKALAWVKADPARHKTAKGMKKFLVGWFGRAQDNGHANGNGKQKTRESFRDRGILRGTPEQEAAERRLIAQVLGGAPDEEEGFGWPE